MHRILAVGAVALLLVADAQANYPAYEQVAASPGAYKGTVRFYMRFEGLKSVDAAFAPIKRNSSTHLQLIEPAGKRRVPMFVSLRSGWLVRKLRSLPTGVTYRFEGKMRYFKTAVYNAESLKNMKMPSLKIESQQSSKLKNYSGSGTSATVEMDTEGAGPEAAGYEVHHILDIKAYKVVKQKEKPASAKADKPAKAQNYQKVQQRDIGGLGDKIKTGGGIPVNFKMPYLGVMGALSGQSQLKTLTSSFQGPKVSCVKGGDLEMPDPTANLKVISPPGPLKRLVVIVFGSDWDVAKDLEGLKSGDMMEVSGTLSAAPEGTGSKFVLTVEGVKKVARTGPPRLRPGKRPGPGGGGPPFGR